MILYLPFGGPSELFYNPPPPNSQKSYSASETFQIFSQQVKFLADPQLAPGIKWRFGLYHIVKCLKIELARCVVRICVTCTKILIRLGISNLDDINGQIPILTHVPKAYSVRPKVSKLAVRPCRRLGRPGRIIGYTVLGSTMYMALVH